MYHAAHERGRAALADVDPELRQEVERLLEQDSGGKLLDRPAADMLDESAAARLDLAGRTVSHYRIIGNLGSGGMGVVYKAEDTRLHRLVALKFLPSAEVANPERKRRLIQEARAASALSHPHIVTIYEVNQADGVDFIAMEFVPGNTLDQLIQRRRLRPDEALHYAIQVAGALAAAHAAGIVHRDLKPGNIMVNEDGGVKVLDFGLAKLTAQRACACPGADAVTGASKTEEGVIVGTVAYMSPEQAQGKEVDARTDIFSFGAVLYEMITGRRAFAGDSPPSIWSAVLRDQPKPVEEITPGISRELARIVMRCLQKDRSRRYQHAGDLEIDLQQVKDDLTSGADAAAPERAARSHIGRGRWLAVAAACVAVALGVEWRVHGRQPEPPPWKVTRLTADPGLSGFPALSPDGKLVAYSSDRSLSGEQDLYVKQVAGGQPIRLTFDGAGNTTPDFSPDGSKIVFRSNRDGGGIYEIPAFGGDARLLALDGFSPKYSPDGSQVAYWIGSGGTSVAVPGSSTVWVVPTAGGQPRRVGASFTTARGPIWSPDGKRLLFIGYTSDKAYENAVDWWLVGTDDREAVRTGAYQALGRAGLRPNLSTIKAKLIAPDVPMPGCWSAVTNTVIFSLVTSNYASGDTSNLWELQISPQTGTVIGAPMRLTTGAGNEVRPSCAPAGALVFTNVETRTEVWSLPFDLDHGTPRGALEQVTTGPAWREHASLANNGRYVAFASNQSGQTNVWERDLASGKEASVAISSFIQRYPVPNASGSRIAFSAFEKDTRVVYVSAPGGAPEKLCDGCLRATDWANGEKTLLIFGGNPYEIDTIDAASHQQTPILKHPKYNVLWGRYSPDNRWVSFTVRTEPGRAHIAIARLDGPRPVPESAWITIADVGSQDWANWSPDGRTLYFTSAKDGHHCLWGQRLDPNSHRPIGEPFAVQHLHGRVYYGDRGWSAASGRIAMTLVEDSGNIWMMSRPGTH